MVGLKLTKRSGTLMHCEVKEMFLRNKLFDLLKNKSNERGGRCMRISFV